jgi:hypothetical protein
MAAGHTVAVAGSGKLVAVVAAAGFTAFPTSDLPTDAGMSRTRPRDLTPLEPVDPASDEQGFAESFARRGARRHAGALLDIIDNWQPDLVVRDEADFGSAVAAERRAVPCAVVLVLAAGTLLRKELVGPPLHELRRDHQLPPDPDLRMLDRQLVLSPFPRASAAHPLRCRMSPSRTARARPRRPSRTLTSPPFT